MNGTRSPLNVRQLRIVQIVCLVLAVSAVWLVAHTGEPRSNAEFGPIQWAIVFAAAYCAVSGSHLNAFSTKNALELGVVEQVPLLIDGASDI
ncbi:MAG TPA: hypothetical protein VE176_01130 [Candidatus Limnocylindrales bacterium]|nr:hypothetical protein [Candidatus Limnocylindrales bacterium]